MKITQNSKKLIKETKNYKWADGYTYTDVPVFFKQFDMFGFTLTIKSHKTKKRRTGIKLTSDDIWNLYSDILKAL